MSLVIVIVLCLILFFLVAFIFRSNGILLFIIAVIFTLSIRTFIVQAYKIPSGSMIPTLVEGDHILTNKYIYFFEEPQKGDLVIFPYPLNPEQDFVKRVIASGGDTVEIKEKQVYINGDLLIEPYKMHNKKVILLGEHSPRDNLPSITIPDDSLFVMGDNRDNSHDSRFWGVIKKQAVKAKVISIYWSWDIDNGKVRWERVWGPTG